MSEILIGTVDDCFLISGRGCVVAFNYNRSANFKMGDEIKLVTADNEIVYTKIRGIEFIKYRTDVTPDYSKQGILIEDTERNKQKFSKGTEIYLIGDEYVKEDTEK